jgi:hypothetical protein
MIDSAHTTCDICGAVKGETNHWLVAFQFEGYAGITIVPADAVSPDSRTLPKVQADDICGHACATKRFSQFLSAMK